MEFREDIILLLVGAGIALVASLLTGFATIVLNHWLSNKQKDYEKKRRAYYLMGRNLGFRYREGTDKITEELTDMVSRLNEMMEFDDEGDVDVLLGLYEGYAEVWKQHIKKG